MFRRQRCPAVAQTSSARPPEFIADGRTVPGPRVTAIMAEMLGLQKWDKLLEIGTGSASQTQEWAKSGCEVHTIELKPVVEPWRLEDEGINQVYAHVGDGKKGLPQESPFTAMVATCGVEHIPEPWIDQLAENGRMVVPSGNSSIQRLTLYRKQSGSLRPERVAAYVRFSMMR